MRQIRHLLIAFLIIQLTFGSLLQSTYANRNGSGTTTTGNTASLDIVAEAAKKEIPMPASGPAEGALNLTVVPKGTITDATRAPIDVVFVFDKSGSMSDRTGQATKMKLAQDALGEAVKLFKGQNDRFALVPFSSEAESESHIYPLTHDLQSLYKAAKRLDPDGGTNYTTSLSRGKELLKDSTRNKYIFFLTDGMPTVSKKKVPIGNYKGTIYYILFTNGTALKYSNFYPFFYNDGYRAIEQEIMDHGIDVAKQLSQSNIKLYSIGFGDIDGPSKEVDLDYLKKLSEITGATAVHGRPDNLNSVFRAVTDEINRKVLGEVKVKVNLAAPQLRGKVSLTPDAQAHVDENGYAVISMNDVPYAVGGGTPSPQSYNLPLQFSERGTYDFNLNGQQDIYLEYKNFAGQTVTAHPGHVQFVVRDTVPPTFQAAMSYVGSVSELEKWPAGDARTRNTFDVTYTLKAIGDIPPNQQNGKLSAVKLVQELPKGIRVLDSGYTTVTTETGTRVEIPFADVNYGSLSSSPTQSKTLRLRVDWAMNERLQNPDIIYQDHESGKKVVIPAPSDPVKLNVKLPDSRGYTYEANEMGQIKKLINADNTLADAVQLKQGETPIAYPVSSLDFKSGSGNKIILVSYQDVAADRTVTAELPLAPIIGMRETESGAVITDGESANEPVIVSLDELVPDSGTNVSYQYRVTTDGKEGTWITLQDPYSFTLDQEGTHELEVKAAGGFATGEIQRLTVTIKIDRTPPVLTMTANNGWNNLYPEQATITAEVLHREGDAPITTDFRINGIQLSTSDLKEFDPIRLNSDFYKTTYTFDIKQNQTTYGGPFVGPVQISGQVKNKHNLLSESVVNQLFFNPMTYFEVVGQRVGKLNEGMLTAVLKSKVMEDTKFGWLYAPVDPAEKLTGASNWNAFNNGNIATKVPLNQGETQITVAMLQDFNRDHDYTDLHETNLFKVIIPATLLKPAFTVEFIEEIGDYGLVRVKPMAGIITNTVWSYSTSGMREWQTFAFDGLNDGMLLLIPFEKGSNGKNKNTDVFVKAANGVAPELLTIETETMTAKKVNNDENDTGDPYVYITNKKSSQENRAANVKVGYAFDDTSLLGDGYRVEVKSASFTIKDERGSSKEKAVELNATTAGDERVFNLKSVDSKSASYRITVDLAIEIIIKRKDKPDLIIPQSFTESIRVDVAATSTLH